MKSLITGATGFIGAVLARELLRQGHAVCALALPGENASALEKLGVEVRRGDLTQPESLRGVCDGGIGTVYHLAGRVLDWGPRQPFYSTIYEATVNLMRESIGRSSRFVYISSIAALGFGRHLKGFKEGDRAVKTGLHYGDTKLDTEQFITGVHRDGKIACTIVRPVNVTGPGSIWVRDVVEKMLAMPVPLIDGGRYGASMIYVDNLVDGIILAGTRDVAAGKTYHFRDDWNVTWKQYLTDIAAMIGKKPPYSVPYSIARAGAGLCEMVLAPFNVRPPATRMVIDSMGRDMDVDNTLSKVELGWQTKIGYPEALRAIRPWVEKQYGKKIKQ
jgi:nucleoside-diphosphate-sugar epimerase